METIELRWWVWGIAMLIGAALLASYAAFMLLWFAGWFREDEDDEDNEDGDDRDP